MAATGLTPRPELCRQPRAATLADRFWSLSGRSIAEDHSPLKVVGEFLDALDQFQEQRHGTALSEEGETLLALLRRQEVQGDLTYASPEQVRGEPVDERSLVFSVGVLLFEKLTDRHPFGVDRPTQMERLRRGELASGVNYFPRIPAELRAVVVAAIAAFPEERWNNLADFRRQLEAFRRLAQMPEARRALRVRSLPALPERAESRDMDPLTGDSGLHNRFEVTQTGPAPVAPERPTLGTTGLSMQVDLRGKSRMMPLLWMGCGALVSLVALVLFSADVKTPESSSKAAAPAPSAERLAESGEGNAERRGPSAEDRTKADGDARPDRSESKTGAGLGGSTGARDPAEGVANRNHPGGSTRSETDTTEKDAPMGPAAPAFDPEIGGELALSAATGCFSEERLAERSFYFGASLLYDAGTGLSKKIYLGGTEALAAEEKRCLHERLLKLSAGAPPERGTMVIYDFRVSSGGGEVKARIK